MVILCNPYLSITRLIKTFIGCLHVVYFQSKERFKYMYYGTVIIRFALSFFLLAASGFDLNDQFILTTEKSDTSSARSCCTLLLANKYNKLNLAITNLTFKTYFYS